MKPKLQNIKIVFLLFLICMGNELFSQRVTLETDSLKQNSTQTHQKINVGQILFSGVLIPRPSSQEFWYIPSAFELIQFNTIEGFVFNPSVSYTKHLKKRKFFTLKPNLRYGIGNERPQAKLTAMYFYNPQNFSSIELSGGQFVEQFNASSTLGGFGNTYNTLLSKRNFLKIYETAFLKATHIFSPAKDFLFTNTLQWEDRRSLQNLQRFDEKGSDFTSNDPENIELTPTAFKPHQAFLWHAQIKWKLDHRYKRHRGKFVSTSNHPALSVSFTSAFSDIFGTDVSFQKLSLALTDRYKVGVLGKGQFLIEAGDFLSKDSLSFIDFNHFNGNQSAYNSFGINGFQLLDYYQYSTSSFYLHSHIQHKVNPFSIGKKPLIIRPVLSLNYLHTTSTNYLEFGIGLEKVFKHWRLEFYSSINNGSFESVGIRFGYLLST